MTTRRDHKDYSTTGLKTVMDQSGKMVGQFEAIVAAFGNVDLQGDRTMPGSWDNSIDRWKSSGERIPVIWSHDWGDPLSFVGSVDPSKVVEVPDVGYKVQGELDLSTDRGNQVYKLLGGYGDPALVKEFSFAYDVKAERMADDFANELTELDIIELGPTLKGANGDAVLLGVKSDADEIQAKAIDNSSWDGQAAMSKCVASQNPAAAFRAVCAGKRDGPPDEAGTWALPHHKSPGSPPNAAGVTAALGRLGQTQGLTNADAAKSHLEAHQREIEASKSAVNTTKVDVTDPAAFVAAVAGGEKSGRVLSAKNEKLLRDAMGTIESVLSALGEEDAAAAVADAGKSGAKNDPEPPEPQPEPETAEDRAWLRTMLVEKGLDGDEFQMVG